MTTGKIKVNFKMPTPTAAERLHALQQKNRKAAGLPDPSEYKKKLDAMKSEQTLPDVDNNPDRPNAGRYSSGSAKPVKRVTPIATPSVNEEDVTIVKVGLDEAKKMEYDQKKVNHLKYVVGILEKEKKEFSRLKDSKEVMDIIDKAINMFAKEYTKHLNALSAGRGQDTNFRVIEEVELDEMIRVKTNKPIGTRIADIGPGGKEYNVKTDKTWDDSKKKQPQGADFAAQRRKERLAKNGRMDEDAEQIDEISDKLKASYVAGAKKQIKQSIPYTKKGEEYRDIAKNFIAKRERGIAKVTESADDDPKADQMTTDDTKFPKKSRKAQIVKSAAKKLPPEDQFQAKPVLDSQVTQQTNK